MANGIYSRFYWCFLLGYADSTASTNMTESSVVNDVVHIYKWLKERTKAKIFIWGHSLGSAVATHVTANLKKARITPMGVVLETPFTSVIDVMKLHPIVKVLVSFVHNNSSSLEFFSFFHFCLGGMQPCWTLSCPMT